MGRAMAMWPARAPPVAFAAPTRPTRATPPTRGGAGVGAAREGGGEVSGGQKAERQSESAAAGAGNQHERRKDHREVRERVEDAEGLGLKRFPGAVEEFIGNQEPAENSQRERHHQGAAPELHA